MKHILFLIFCMLILTTYPISADIRIAIIDFDPVGVSKTESLLVSDIIRNELINIKGYTVIEKSQMNLILREQEFQQTGCTDVTCAVKMGKLLSARKMLLGSVIKMDRGIILSGRIVDVERGIAEFSETGIVKTDDDLVKAATIFTRNLSRKINSNTDTIKFDEKGEGFSFSDLKLNISIGYDYMMALGDFKKLAETGMGGSLGISSDIFGNFNIGFCTGYYNFPGKEEWTDNLIMIPVLATVGYRISFFSNFHIMPIVSGGGLYISVKQYDGTDSKFENLFRAGVNIQYYFYRGMYVQIKSEYNTILEEDKTYGFISYNAGVGYRL